jgi:hypothetical protein
VVSFLPGFLPRLCMHFCSPSFVCYVLCTSRLPWFDRSNNTRWRVQLRKLVIKQCSPVFRHFVPNIPSPQITSAGVYIFIRATKFHTHTENNRQINNFNL